MGAEDNILEHLAKNPEGASTTEIAEATGHTRATSAKYLEVMKQQNRVDCREVGKAKLWVLAAKRKRVLIAEDEEYIRRLIKVILTQDHYDFIEARDGNEALEKVSEEMPDLLILDLMMPKTDGIEVCRQLKKNALTRKIPVIMLTAKREMTDRVVGIKAGADDYLTKPFEPSELRVRVRTFLDKEKRARSLITNLPTFNHVAEALNKSEKSFDVYYLFFKNLDVYKKYYGFSKTNELLRLASQIITHNLERHSRKNFAGHDDENNFIIAVEKNNERAMLRDIQHEFDATIPFFYDVDYENVDLRGNVIIKMSAKGKVEKIPLIGLRVMQLTRHDIENIDKLNDRLKQLRGG